MKENERKCIKCGSSPAEDPNITLHRFPKPGRINILRCELWAKYCFPHDSWSSPEFQNQLYSKHYMLCNKHFNKSSFVDHSGKRLFKSAAPDEECDKITSTQPVLVHSNLFEPIAGPSKTRQGLAEIKKVVVDVKLHIKQTEKYHSTLQDDVPSEKNSSENLMTTKSDPLTTDESDGTTLQEDMLGNNTMEHFLTTKSEPSETTDETELLSVCRTCLHTEANNPIFTDEVNAASHSEIVFIVTGVKVEKDDGLPQNICQNCLNTINNCLDFRKQCQESETQLLIIKNQIENVEYNLDVKSEVNNREIRLGNHTSNELKGNKIAPIVEDTEMMMDDSITAPNNTKDGHLNNKNKKENLANNKSFDSNKDVLKRALKNVSDVNKQRDHGYDAVVCKLCKEMIEKRNFLTHMVVKHNYINKTQINNHKLTHTKNRHKEIMDDGIALNKFTNDNNLSNESVNSEIEKEHFKISKEIILNTYTRKTTANNKIVILKWLNSENDNFSQKQEDILINNSSTTDNENLCNVIESEDDFLNKSLDSEIDESNLNKTILSNKMLAVKNEVCSDEQTDADDLTNKLLPYVKLDSDTATNKSMDAEVQKQENLQIEKEEELNEIVATEDYILYNYDDKNRVTCKLCQKDLSVRSVTPHMATFHPAAHRRGVQLNRHMSQQAHGAPGYTCRFCKSSFDDRKGLLKHTRSCSAKKYPRICQSGRELRECEQCHKVMQRASLRQHHATAHAGLRPVCEHCGNSFGNKSRLLEHRRAKHGYAKLTCPYEDCDFQTACTMSLRNHERRHRGETPFVCETCGARFHAAYLLAQHRQSHAAHKTYQCQLCPASFKTNNTLHTHRRARHGARTYACSECARTYAMRAYLLRHMRAAHAFTGPAPLTTIE